jgi:hypothetical protein
VSSVTSTLTSAVTSPATSAVTGPGAGHDLPGGLDDLPADLDLLSDAAFDALYDRMDIRELDQGVPTDLVDSSVLTSGSDPAFRTLSPAELVPPDPATGPHPLTTTPAGPELATLLDVFDLGTLTDAGLVAYAGATERVKSWAEAAQAAATAELTDRCARLRGVGVGPDEVSPDQLAATELAAGLGLSAAAAGLRVDFAAALTRLPGTRAALTAGRIDAVKARAIADSTAPLDDATAVAVETRVLHRASTQTAPMLRAALRRAVIAADPAAAEQRRATAVTDRGVWREAIGDGLSRLEWVAPSEQIEAAHQWISALAERARDGDRGGNGPVRTLDQCRSDVLADIADHALRHQALPRRHGRAPQIQVVVAASTLLGLDDEPAELVGVGPVTAATARLIAADGTWRRLLTDLAGRLVDVSTDTYEPTQAMRDHVGVRDRTCQGPGCRVPAARCDLDHTIAWPCGPTCIGNLCPLCRTHHRIKTLTDTRLEREPDPGGPGRGPGRGPGPGRRGDAPHGEGWSQSGYGHGDLVWTLPSGQRHSRAPDPVIDHPALDSPSLRDSLRQLARDPDPPPRDGVPPF